MAVTEGVIATSVDQDSVAAEQRFHPGDIITEVNGQRVNTPKQFRELAQGGNGQPVLIQLISNGVPEFRILKEDNQ